MRERKRTTGGASCALAAAAIVALAAPAAAREVFKVATLAPQGSVWDTSLREMGATWARDTAGGVELRVYPGGVAGDESDVVRKMRIGQFQGAALTVAGLAEIDPAFQVFAIPMFFESWEEVHHVLAELRPELERRLAAKGYVLVLWGHGGWVHLFSRQPIRTLDDLKKQKLFVWAGDDGLVQRWRQQGYQPVALSATDVTMGFQTGMIDVIPTTPIAALSLQWFRQTPYMQGLGLAPLVGGVVIQRAAWEKVPAAEREKLAAAALVAEGRLAAEVPRQDTQAIEQMKARGLSVVEVEEAQRMIWRRAADDFAGRDGQSAAPPEVLAATRAALTAFRSGKGGAR
ncbi:MAG: dicarboxylate transporter-DctP subunit [Acidobacteria bacterium]|nr:dicarboxylate transporter-DctP subunit [Acidobacteriota bacterium]